MYKLLLTASLLLALGAAQSPIIFMPGPGANDGTDEGGLSGGKDTWIYDGNSTTNYGDNSICYSLPVTTCNNTNVTGFIKFDLTTLPTSVDSVFFAGWTWDLGPYCYSNCDNNWELWYISTPWNEMTMTWNTPPTLDSAIAGPFRRAYPDSAHFVKYDITDAYRNWKSGTVPNHGLALKPIDGSCNNAAVSFGVYSSDDTTAAGTKRAHLIIYASTVGIPEPVGRVTATTFPNPTTGTFSIQYNQTTSGTAVLSVMDPTGRMVLVQEYNNAGGATTRTLDLGGLPGGLYRWHLNTPDGIATGSVVKQ